MQILTYALAAAVLVLTGAIISGGVVLPRRLPKEMTENTPEDTLSRDLAALMNYGREEENNEI